MKSREEQLQSCMICMKRKFLLEKGLVCSLTNEWADFEENCINFELDDIAKDRIEQNKVNRQEDSLAMETAGLHRIGIKNGAVAGFTIVVLGLIWLIGGLIYMDLIFYYPFGLILIGVTLIINYYVGVYRKKKKASLIRNQEDIIDSIN